MLALNCTKWNERMTSHKCIGRQASSTHICEVDASKHCPREDTTPAWPIPKAYRIYR